MDSAQGAGRSDRLAVARLPERLPGSSGLVLRRWVPDDASALNQAVAESVEHLRPWMPWIADEPLSLEARRALILGWEHAWLEGNELLMGIFVRDHVAGGCGLHRRIGPGGLEIGYWVHPSFLRRGLATEAARRLTEAALAAPGISHVEIRHDKANLASAAIPRKLGFRLIDERSREPAAPGEIGIECRWRIEAT